MSHKSRPVEPVYDENVKGSLSDLKQEISSLLGVLTSSVWKSNEEHVVVNTTKVQRSTATTRTNTPHPSEAPSLSFTVPSFQQHHRQISPKRNPSHLQVENSNSSSSPSPHSQTSPTSVTRTASAGVGVTRGGVSHRHREDVIGSAFQKLTLIKEQYHAAREEIIRTAATPQTCRSLQTSDAGSGDEQNPHMTLSHSRQSSVRRVLHRDSSCQSSLGVGVGIGVQCDEHVTTATGTGTEPEPTTANVGTGTVSEEFKTPVKEVKQMPPPTPTPTPPAAVAVTSHHQPVSGPSCPQQCAPLPNLRRGSTQQKAPSTSGRSSPAPSSAPLRKELPDGNIQHTQLSTGANSPDPEPLRPPEPTVLREPLHTRASLRDETHISTGERNLAIARKTPPPSLGGHSNPPSLQNSDVNTKRSELGEPKKEPSVRTTRNTTGRKQQQQQQQQQEQKGDYLTPDRVPNSHERGSTGEVEKTIPQKQTSRLDVSPPPQSKLVTKQPREARRQSVGEQELLALSGPGRRSISAGSQPRRNSIRSNSEKERMSRKSHSAADEHSHADSADVSVAESRRTSSRKIFESELRSRRTSAATTRLTVETSKQSERKRRPTRNSDLKEAARRASNINQAIENQRNRLQVQKDSAASSISPSSVQQRRNTSNHGRHHHHSVSESTRRSSIASVSPSRERTSSAQHTQHRRNTSHPTPDDIRRGRRPSATSSISPSRDRTTESVEKDIRRHRSATERRASSVERHKKQRDASFNERTNTVSPHTQMQQRTSLSIQRDIERRRSASQRKAEGGSRSRSNSFSRSGGQQSQGQAFEFNEISIPITASFLEGVGRKSSDRRTSSATQRDRDQHLRASDTRAPHPRSRSSGQGTSPRKSATAADFVAFGGSSNGTSPSKSTGLTAPYFDVSGYTNAYEKRKSHQQQTQQRSRNRSHSGISDAGDNDEGPGDCPYSRSRTLLFRHLNDSAARFQHMLDRRDSGRIVTLDEYRSLAPLDLNTFVEWQNATQDILACMLEEVSVGRWKHKPWNFHTFMKNVGRRLQVIRRATDMNENLSSHFRTATGRKYYI